MTDFANAVSADGQTLLVHLKLFLGIEPSDTSNDQKLSSAIDLSGNFCETYIDTVILLREVTQDFAHHFGTVVLHQVPASQLTTVEVNGVIATDYSWWKKGSSAILSRTGHRQDVPMDWRQFDQVVVTYIAGYAPIPSDLTYAITATAADLYNAEGTGSAPGGATGDMKSLQIYDVGAVTYDVGGSGDGGSGSWGENTGALNSTSSQILTRYKRLSA